MARYKKTPDYTVFWIFWLLLILFTLFSCQTSRQENHTHTEFMTSGHKMLMNQRIIDSLMRNFTFTFTGLELWITPDNIPLQPDTTKSDTNRNAAPSVHLRADKATATFSEKEVTEAIAQMQTADSTQYSAQCEEQKEVKPQHNQSGRFVIVLFLLITIFIYTRSHER